jgi:hypothetical protein
MKSQKAQCVLTKFFYVGNHLHFEILIQTELEVFNYGYYSDYRLYKKELEEVQQALTKELKVSKLIEKKLNAEINFANVA